LKAMLGSLQDSAQLHLAGEKRSPAVDSVV
jgi:hypothetical protein